MCKHSLEYVPEDDHDDGVQLLDHLVQLLAPLSQHGQRRTEQDAEGQQA